MSRPNTITVSRSKRGTTVHARGAAAQALFDDMARRKEFEAALRLPERPPPHEVHFEDHGQDFLRWDVDEKGVVTASYPFQSDLWAGCVLVDNAKPGQRLRIFSHTLRREMTVAYPVTKVVARLELLEGTAKGGMSKQEG
jgi:hypothetical protein